VFRSLSKKNYQLAPLAKLRLYTWSPWNIYHSLVDSNEIHRSFASIGLKSNSTTKYSIIQASTQLDLSWMWHLVGRTN
jgi:hypothetical protein